MNKLIVGIFKDSQDAGHAAGDLKAKGYTNEISLVAKDKGGDKSTHTVKEYTKEGTVAGAATGAVVGVLTGMIAGISAITIPGLGLVLAGGPLVAAGGVMGAVAGGLVGTLVDAGIPEDKAKMFEDYVSRGEVLLTVATDDDHTDEVANIMKSHNVSSLDMFGAK